MSESTHGDLGGDAVADLRAAVSEYHDAKAAVDEHGRDSLEELGDTLRQARGLLSQHQDSATDTGAREFVSFAQFKRNFVSLVQGLDDDAPGRDAVEAARECVDKNRLSERDFERAREALEPADELVGLVDELEAARKELRNARRRARDRREELEAEVDERERLLELGEADLDASIEELREPIERWNGAIREGVDEHLHDATARETFALLDRAELFPLVELPTPPDHLREFVETTPAGEYSIRTLLEYADYSRSKLAHYVDDADRLKREVATERTFLESLGAGPLTVDWPPPLAEHVPWLTRELRAVGGRLADEDGLAALRDLERAARDREHYERLRTAAVADAGLDPDDRRRLKSGDVEDEIAELEATIEQIDDVLADAPDP